MMNIGLSELVKHEQAILAPISSFNKPQNTNKLMAYCILRQLWGQGLGANPGGVHWSRGQNNGQQVNSGRKGL